MSAWPEDSLPGTQRPVDTGGCAGLVRNGGATSFPATCTLSPEQAVASP